MLAPVAAVPAPPPLAPTVPATSAGTAPPAAPGDSPTPTFLCGVCDKPFPTPQARGEHEAGAHLKKKEDLVDAIRRVANAASPIDDLRIKAGLAVVRDSSYRPAREVDCVTE